MKHYLFSLMVLSLLVLFGDQAMSYADSGADQPKVETVSTHKNFGNLEQVLQYKNLYFAGQPNEAAFKHFKELGGVAVINLREPLETDFDEQPFVEELGLKYYSFPVSGRKELNASIMKKIGKAVLKEGDVPIMIHCSSGNRAAAWLATHLVTVQKDSLDNALNVAKSVGLTSKALENKVVYLLTGKR